MQVAAHEGPVTGLHSFEDGFVSSGYDGITTRIGKKGCIITRSRMHLTRSWAVTAVGSHVYTVGGDLYMSKLDTVSNTVVSQIRFSSMPLSVTGLLDTLYVGLADGSVLPLPL
jgi:hypothetical protein